MGDPKKQDKATRKTVYLRVPCYICYDVSGLEEDEGEGLGDFDALIEDLQDNLKLDYDSDDAGFASADIRYDEAVEVDEKEAEHGGVIPCRDGQTVTLILRDPDGNEVRNHPGMDVNAAGDEARRFLILHGGDPDEAGRGAQVGSIRFIPDTEE